MWVLESGGKSNSEVNYYRCAAICFVYWHLRGIAVDRHLSLYISKVDEVRFFGVDPNPSSTSNGRNISRTLSI